MNPVSKRIIWSLLLMGGLILFLPISALANTTDDSNYGSGKYGDCNYGSCSITLSSAANVNLDISPTQTGSCTIASNTVSVETDSTSGYIIQLNSNTTSTNLINGASTIATTSGTAPSPSSLVASSWGWRIDGYSGFGAGPTTAQVNVPAPVSGFAGVPSSIATPATIASSASPANPAVNTTVWYGLCADTSVINGTYTTTVTYTATVN